MPYVLITTQVRLESGPCTVGDEHSDPELMRYLEAKLIKQLGNNFMEWRTELVPRQVLNKLEEKGYSVVCMTGVGQTCIWTLVKSEDSAQPSDSNGRQAASATLNGHPTYR